MRIEHALMVNPFQAAAAGRLAQLRFARLRLAILGFDRLGPELLVEPLLVQLRAGLQIRLLALLGQLLHRLFVR